MNKNFYNIDEIAQILNEQKHTIRFWESRISKLKVLRTHSGHRLYNYENLLLLKKIKELVDVQKLTLDGVNEYFSNSKVKKNTLNVSLITELRDLLGLLKKSN
jgi:DNA-binding transcriptional MerR regulator